MVLFQNIDILILLQNIDFRFLLTYHQISGKSQSQIANQNKETKIADSVKFEIDIIAHVDRNDKNEEMLSKQK